MVTYPSTHGVYEETIREICSIVDGPVSAECVSLEAPELIKEGRTLAKIHDNVVVKIPMGVEGMKAVKALTSEGIRTNVTLVFSANQALLCAKAGATYVSPFVGRLDDISQDGMELISHIIEIYRNYDFDTQVLEEFVVLGFVQVRLRQLGFGDTAAIFCPRSAFISVDLPTLGRPSIAMNAERKSVIGLLPPFLQDFVPASVAACLPQPGSRQ